MLNFLSAAETAYDTVSLGEVMLRLCPGEGRVRAARRFDVYEGGGEYNVARGLSRCFNKRACVITAFPDNDVGRLAEGLIMAGGVDTRFIKRLPFDGIGEACRVGLNFTERGFGLRGAAGISDRANSAASKLTPGDIDFNTIFSVKKTRHFHTGGIFAALSGDSARCAAEAARAAKKAGAVVSFDINYRPSLWKRVGGPEKAAATNAEIVKYADILIGNEEDYTLGLGIESPSGLNLCDLNKSDYEKILKNVMDVFPNVKIAASTLRTVKSACVNDFTALCRDEGGQMYYGMEFLKMEVLDRVGGGDSFVSGFLNGLLDGKSVQTALDMGVCHGALAVTTPGDISLASESEVLALMAGGSARITR